MLTPKQVDFIHQNGIATLHDYWGESLFSGEPFFENGILSYYDGRVVTVCGYPLCGESSADDAVVNDLCRGWADERNAEAILYIGPQPQNFSCLRDYGFRCTHNKRGGDISAEVLIDCSGTPNVITDHSFYRRALKMGFESRVKTGDIVPVDYIRLIEIFYKRTAISGYLVKMAFALPALLRSCRVQLIEARLGGRLCGFATLHRAFAHVAVGLFLAHDCQTPGVSDFLYGELLVHAQRLGVKYVNVGQSPRLGHYNFKLKWGGTPAVPPHYYIQWVRGRLSRKQHPVWAARIILP